MNGIIVFRGEAERECRQSASLCSVLSSGNIDDFVPRPACKLGHDGVRAIAQKADRAIAEGKVCTAGVWAPKVKHATLIRKLRRPERIGPRSARRSADYWLQILFAYSKDEIRRAAEALTDPAVPPTELEVRARRAFAEHQRVAGAVGDRVKCHGLVLVQHAVLAAVIFAGDAEVAGEGHEVPGPLRHLRRPHAAIAGASVGLDDRAAVNVRRIGERLICDAECGETFGVDVLLFDVRQDVESPAGERHCV